MNYFIFMCMVASLLNVIVSHFSFFASLQIEFFVFLFFCGREQCGLSAKPVFIQPNLKFEFHPTGRFFRFLSFSPGFSSQTGK
jgi:hypothetical protein